MILEKLTVDEDSLIFFACNARNFFAISVFSMIVSLSAIIFDKCSFSYLHTDPDHLQKCQFVLSIPICGNIVKTFNLIFLWVQKILIWLHSLEGFKPGNVFYSVYPVIYFSDLWIVLICLRRWPSPARCCLQYWHKILSLIS